MDRGTGKNYIIRFFLYCSYSKTRTTPYFQGKVSKHKIDVYSKLELQHFFVGTEMNAFFLQMKMNHIYCPIKELMHNKVLIDFFIIQENFLGERKDGV